MTSDSAILGLSEVMKVTVTNRNVTVIYSSRDPSCIHVPVYSRASIYSKPEPQQQLTGFTWKTQVIAIAGEAMKLLRIADV